MKKRPWSAAIALILIIAVVSTLLLNSFAEEGSTGILYRVDGPHGTAYLLGSIHIGTDTMYPFSDTITQAMENSDTFIFESDSSGDSARMLQTRMALSAGTLREILGDALMDRVLEAYRTIGVNSAMINHLQPWVVISTLAVYSTANEFGITNIEKGLSLGVDNVVESYAAEHNKQLAYLETVTDFADMMESFSPELIQYLIADEVNWILQDNQAAQTGDLKEWPVYWRNGDVDSFIKSNQQSVAEADPLLYEEYEDKLITQRNVLMAARLDEMLDSGGTYFMTVGLLHLISEDSNIPELLRQKGYTVERLMQ